MVKKKFGKLSESEKEEVEAHDLVAEYYQKDDKTIPIVSIIKAIDDLKAKLMRPKGSKKFEETERVPELAKGESREEGINV